ncbi:MAG: Gfo/Idh/MocA family oxidoreductase [Planctomycetota bacterium]|nr:Gfo/Idh/MocA family oxidoreductase [Planctomycetota bacterium]
MPRNFAVIGVGGYIAPRHLRAIRDTGNRLVAAVDPKDSVGILDQFSYDVSFFTEFERFDRHIERLRRLHADDQRVHYVSICSPNHLHDAHIRFALRVGADAICEKPLVLNPWNCDALAELEAECGRRVYTVLQLRLHPALIALKKRIAAEPPGRRHEVVLTYITARGLWYFFSWKGAVEKSGGLATNIGIHFFDLLIWLFGAPLVNELHHSEPKRASGYLELERATVKWYLSVAPEDVPAEIRAKGKMTYRSLTLDGQEVEFSEGFTDLHTRVYEEVLQGRGFGIAEVKPSIQLAHDIRHAAPLGPQPHSHELLQRLAK